METTLICILLIIGIIIMFIILQLFLIYNRKINEKIDQIESNLFTLTQKSASAEGFQIATYNNSIRIAKKLNVYYCLNKDDYEKHQQSKEKSLQNNNNV